MSNSVVTLACNIEGASCTTLQILVVSITLILLLLCVVKCITADDFFSVKSERPQKKKQKITPQKPKNEILHCPMCGWRHPAEQKVCRNPKCNIRF